MVAAYYTTTRPEMTQYIPHTVKRVLEIGCGAGGFSARIEADEKWGVEPNREAAQAAGKCLTRLLDGIYTDVENELPDNYFSLVIANDVIEHMPDHDAFLQSIKRKMAPGAVLVGSLPNMRHITALVKLLVLKDWEYKDDGILDRTHLRFFTRKSIVKALEDNGYRIEKLGGTNSVLKRGFVNAKRLHDAAGRALTLAAITASLGYYWDVQYPQYGFAARPV